MLVANIEITFIISSRAFSCYCTHVYTWRFRTIRARREEEMCFGSLVKCCVVHSFEPRWLEQNVCLQLAAKRDLCSASPSSLLILPLLVCWRKNRRTHPAFIVEFREMVRADLLSTPPLHHRGPAQVDLLPLRRDIVVAAARGLLAAIG